MLELIVSVRDFVRTRLTGGGLVLGSWSDDFTPHFQLPATRLRFLESSLERQAPEGPALRETRFELAALGRDEHSGELLKAVDAMLTALPAGSRILLREVSESGGGLAADGSLLGSARLAGWTTVGFARERENPDALLLSAELKTLNQMPPGGYET